MKKFLKNEKGLTLIELLAVIVILGIIAAIAIPTVGGIIQKSKENGVKADAITVLNAAKTYVAENGIPEPATGSSDSLVDIDTLKQYIDRDVKLDKTGSTYTKVTVKISADGTNYQLYAEKKIGKTTITFSGATISGINADNKYSETRTINN
jgi:type IV pilus assembly protein PilA